MKILLLTDGIYPFELGGMQSHSYFLAKYLLSQNVELTLVHCSTKEINISEKETQNALAYQGDLLTSIFIPFPKEGKIPGHYIRRSYNYSCRAYEKIKDVLMDFSVVFIQGLTGEKTLEELQGKSSPKTFIHFHGFEMFQPITGISNRLKQTLLKPTVTKNCHLSDYIFSFGPKISEIITQKIKIDDTKIIELPGAIPKEKIQPNTTPTSKQRRFLFVGRYEERKGIHFIHKAIDATFTLNDPEILAHCFFDFVGPIPPKKQIHHSNVTYHGLIKDYAEIEKIYRSSDVLLAPSLSEGMPIVIMEAMANGLAIMASDVGANNLLVGEQNGMLLDTSCLDGFAANINQFVRLSDQDLANKKKNSLHKIEQFTWESVGEKTLNTLKKCL